MRVSRGSARAPDPCPRPPRLGVWPKTSRIASLPAKHRQARRDLFELNEPHMQLARRVLAAPPPHSISRTPKLWGATSPAPPSRPSMRAT
jgi:hypothetical protein